MSGELIKIEPSRDGVDINIVHKEDSHVSTIEGVDVTEIADSRRHPDETPGQFECDYRVKPELKCRPFVSIEELVDWWEKHYQDKKRPEHTMPLIWVIEETTGFEE